jgi:hypothetical protein
MFIIILLWIAYFFRRREGFIGGLIRPHIRKIRNHYEHFTNNYGVNVIINKLKKYNIY